MITLPAEKDGPGPTELSFSAQHFKKNAVDSMHEGSSDDFDLLNGVNSTYEKGMCLAIHRVTPNTSSIVPGGQQPMPATENDANNYIASVVPTTVLNSIKIADAGSTDLFPTHPTTWQQHPMNRQELAHHRLQNHQHSHQHRHVDRHQHRLDLITSKILLQSSDDPLICRGANSVVGGDDDHPLIVAASQNAENNLNDQGGTIQTNSSSSVSSKANLRPLPSMGKSTQLSVKVPLNGCSSLTKQQLKVKAGLMSAQNRAANELKRSIQQTQSTTSDLQKNHKSNEPKLAKNKGVLKLRFHHQALPPEYLSHYEATQAKFSRRDKDIKAITSEDIPKAKTFHPSKFPPPKSSHENVRSWLQKIAAIHRSAQQSESKQGEEVVGQQQKKSKNDSNNNYQASRMQTSSLELPDESVVRNEPHATSKQVYNNEKFERVKSSRCKFVPNPVVKVSPPVLSDVPKKVINYADLPYMGEITLDHSKPRRGRKPKKADICHLIYKNYGTIFPGTPKSVLTTPHATIGCGQRPPESEIFDELPLNLCMRDQLCDHLSISSEDSDCVSDPSDGNSPSKELIESVKLLKTDLDSLLDLKSNPVKVEPKDETRNSDPTSPSLTNLQSPKSAEHNVLLHPVSLYYQKLLSGTLVNQHSQPFGLPVQTIEKDNQLTLKIPIPNGLLQTPKSEKLTPLLNVDNPMIDYPDILSTPSSIKSENSNMTTTTAVSATTATTMNPSHQQITPQKRKRSAIFIPPIPSENATNPATEVSICKFKFTGGAKPTLEEKKMLSVDSGGNYRYYSGTGDKSTRGYEFFPRESLQNSAGFLPGVNCAATFSHAASECLTSDIPPPSADLSNEILQIPESPTATLLPGSVTLPEPSSPSPLSRPISSFSGSPALATQQKSHNLQTTLCSKSGNVMSTGSVSSRIILAKDHFTNALFEPSSSYHSIQRKKKSRRSSQREKLERTFKEKGFLIQTQQLESAEGATYCKFRQLKKFTRYLFRNWKDYLPEEVHRANAAENVEVMHQPITEEDVKNEANTQHNFTEQLGVESLLQRHGFLVTSRVCPQNADRPSAISSVVENVVLEQNSLDNTVQA
ncbi:uncharacterized protein LOC118740246 [Rhagoletis pomonella]|uniref:uncharacterized protein LOC118740246 n=1 Tax=Rhagoletis pomonella TaxID=28610 RepID=UPI00177DB52F|nr:uncharacterized protein LOC118740246 [Rhagoletis pomonella]